MTPWCKGISISTTCPLYHWFASYYLPHPAVLKPESTTTKLRVLFNVYSPSKNRVNLNDILHAGPVLQSDITTQWRYFRYAYSADIEKMHRQIWVNSKHIPFQRILFRNSEEYIRDYQLQTVTFEVNSAPFLTIRVLQQLATDVQLSHPRAEQRHSQPHVCRRCPFGSWIRRGYSTHCSRA